ncbi:MAG: toprim domain-containing protein, partial [bacterium]|nr:toprim domain-containing protein [bacterium]
MRENEDVIALLHPRLKDYLESQGVAINDQGFFSCIHPTHADVHPSCSINKGKPEYENKVFHCFSGRHSGNIFTAAYWLEDMPIQGDEFWTNTVAELCKRFDIDYKPLEVSPDRRQKYQALRAHRDAASIITSMAWEGGELQTEHPGIAHLLERGITMDSISRFNIGVVSSFKEYHRRMRDLGWTSEEYLQSISLLRKSIFRRDGFILPIYNMKNQPVAFVTRNTSFLPNEHTGEKYYNSVNSNIYSKGDILYNYNNVVKENGALYIVEGYLDAIYLQQCGIKKVAAIGAVYITDQHVDMLFNNETDINLAFDGDGGGV